MSASEGTDHTIKAGHHLTRSKIPVQEFWLRLLNLVFMPKQLYNNTLNIQVT